MSTPLHKAIRREVLVGKQAYTVTIAPTGIKIVPKGRRKGQEITWEDLVSGTTELDIKLKQSLAANGRESPAARRPALAARRSPFSRRAGGGARPRP